jgi:hypothetical protein
MASTEELLAKLRLNASETDKTVHEILTHLVTRIEALERAKK